jgi:hypothetical protein
MPFFNSNVDALLRQDLDSTYTDMAFGDNLSALIGMMKKKDQDGDGVKVPLKASFGPGQGATAATAYINAGLANRYAFSVTPFKLYGQSIIDLSQSIFARGNDNSVVDLLMDESKTAMDNAKNQVDQALSQDGSGTLGTIKTATNTSGNSWTLVLSQASDINNFQVNQVLVQKATAFAGSLQAGTAVVNNVLASTSSIIITSTGMTPTATYVLGVQGTMAGSTTFVQWPGIPAWIPPIASRPVSATAFFGQDRSVEEQRLSGSALDGTGMGILEGINKLAHIVANVPGATPDLVACSFNSLGKMQADLQTAARYVDVKGKDIDVFYRALEIQGPRGPMYVLPSSHWQDSLVGVLSSDSWTLGSPGNKPFAPATTTGSPIVEIPGLDQAVAQYRAAGFVYCDAPGHNGMLTVTP